jgi:hypothetical protein
VLPLAVGAADDGEAGAVDAPVPGSAEFGEADAVLESADPDCAGGKADPAQETRAKLRASATGMDAERTRQWRFMAFSSR